MRRIGSPISRPNRVQFFSIPSQFFSIFLKIVFEIRLRGEKITNTLNKSEKNRALAGFSSSYFSFLGSSTPGHHPYSGGRAIGHSFAFIIATLEDVHSGIPGLSFRQMDRSLLVRWTLDADPITFLSPVAWFLASAPRPACMWWDLQHFHRRCSKLGYGIRLVDFMRWIRTTVHMQPALRGGPHVHIRSADTPPNIVTSICTTVAMYTFLLHLAQFARVSEVATDLQTAILAAVSRACECVNVGGSTLHCECNWPSQLYIYRDGHVCGFWLCCERNLVRSSKSCVLRAWGELRAAGKLDGECVSESHSIRDIMSFILLFGRHRREQNKNALGHALKFFMSVIQASIVAWLSAHLETYAFTVYAVHHDVLKSPPSYHSIPSLSARTYVRMDCEGVWDLVQEARSTKVPIQHVLKVRKLDASCGADSTLANRIEPYMNGLYLNRAHLSFKGVSHLCLSADASIHSYQNTLVGWAYSWERDVAAYAPLQRIKPGRDILKCEETLEGPVRIKLHVNQSGILVDQ